MPPHHCALLLLFAAPLAAQSSAMWELVGPPAISDGSAICCQIAVARDGTPYVAFQDQSTAAIRCSVMQHRNGAWSYVGIKGGASNGQAWYNKLAIDTADRVYLACRDYASSGRISVRTFDTTTGSWTNVGPSGSSPGEAHYTDIAIAPDGAPTVIFADRTTAPADEASALVYRNGTWQWLGTQGFSQAGAGYPSLDVDAQGAVYAAFADANQPDAATLTGKASVMRFDPSTASWSYLGNPGFSPHGAQNVTVTLDRLGQPWIAYYRWHAQIVVMRFDGATWLQVGSSGAGADLPEVQTEAWRQWLSLAFDSQNTPYVAYQSWLEGNRASVRRFDGLSWVPVGNTAFSAGAADYLALAMGPSDVPYVVFRDAANLQRVTVMRFAPSPSSYCTAVVNSLGCTPSISASGTPSLSGTEPILIRATNIVSHRTGLLLYSDGGDRAPFYGGFLCVRAPFRRGGTADSGGAEAVVDCSGVLERDLGSYLRAPGSAYTPGMHVFAQFYYRDLQSSAGVGLTDGVRIELLP